MIVNLTFNAPLTLRVHLHDPGRGPDVGENPDHIVCSTVETPNVASMRELFAEGRISIDDHQWNSLDEHLTPELRERLIVAVDTKEWPTPELVS